MGVKNWVNFCIIKRFTLPYIESLKLAQWSFFFGNQYSSLSSLFALFLCLCFSFFFFLFWSPFLHVLLSVYIPPFAFHPHRTCVGWVRRISFCPIQHLLELSMGSCKAVSLLFRYHLHINAARELVEKSLMRRQLRLQIFVYLFPFTLGLWSYLYWWHNSEARLPQDRTLFVLGRTVPRSMASSDEYSTSLSWYWLPPPSVITLWLDLASSDGYASLDGPQAQQSWP